MTKSLRIIFSIVVRYFKERNVATDCVIWAVNGKIDLESKPQVIQNEIL